MARFDTSGLDDLIRDMTRRGESSGPMAEAMVAAATVEIKAAWRESAEAHKLRKTGDMIDAIGVPGPVMKIGDAFAQDIYPQGKDRKGVRNAEKAFILHYGKHGYEPTYWVDDADAASAPKVQARLEAMWADYLETGVVPVVADTGSAVKRRKT